VRAARERIDAVTLDEQDLVRAGGASGRGAVPFGSLIEMGLLKPGAYLTDAKATLKARIKADGSLDASGVRGSIHKIGAHVQGRPVCNGWTFWHFDRSGSVELMPIDALRDEARHRLGLAAHA
jgi:modification methylase